MRVWLDDERPAPTGWTHVKTPQEAIALLESEPVTSISLDHDLGLIHDDHEETGYDVLLWIEERVHGSDYQPPICFVHSANTAAHERMVRAIGSIRRRAAAR